jgi:glycosyltransferase involved in cell wall biosynthesis
MLLGYSPRFNHIACLQALRSRRPILFRAETTDHARERAALHSAVRDRLLRSLYAKCVRLLYVGRRSEEHFRRLGASDSQLVFSPYCVDTGSFSVDEFSRTRLRPITRRELGAGPDQVVVLFSGKLSDRKGAGLLLAAVKALPAPTRERVLVAFVGGGELRDTLAAQAAAMPPVNLRFCGFKNQSELSPYYHAADILALPSRHSETWGLVVNEALHHGLPCVVSTAVGCAPDLIEVGLTGEIAESDSVESLAAALARSVNLAGRPEVRASCRERVSGYTVDRAAQGIAHAYRSIVH